MAASSTITTGSRRRRVLGAVGAGIVVWVVAVLLDAPLLVAVALGGVSAVLVGSSLAAFGQRAGSRRPAIDPFAVSEPWRQFVQRATRAPADLDEIVARTADGAIKDRLILIAAKIDRGVDETWRIARRGDSIDDAVRQLDPVALRSRLEVLQRDDATAHPEQAADIADTADTADNAVTAVERQLATVDRLQAQSRRTASSLQLTQLRVEELVARAAEVSIGSGDTDAYEHDVDDLLVELEALRSAIDETDRL